MSEEIKRYTFKGAAGYYVYSKDYDTAQSQLAALREELATMTADRDAEKGMKATARLQRDSVTRRLADAERRNAELIQALTEAQYRVDQCKVWNGTGWTHTGLRAAAQGHVLDIINAALTKPEEAKS